MTFYHRRLLSFLIVSSWFASISSALHLPVERRTLKRSHSLGKRQMDNSTGFQETIVNSLSTSYFVNITVSGINFTLLMDTGSTDTAIVPASPEQVPDINSTGLPVFLPFAVGSFNGTVGFAPASLGPYEVPSQAIINVTSGNFPDVGAQGVMGLAFSSNTASVIDNAFNDTGMPLVEANLVANIIAHNPSLENYFTITLGRTNDSSAESADGVLTVGELINELEEINTAPEIPQVPPPPGDLVGRWNLAVDGVTISGKSFPLQSRFNVTPPGTAVTILDTGYARPPLPPALAEAIYGQIPGAVLAPPIVDPQFDGALNGTWLVPCSAVPPNVTFVIGGKSYPLHPLDITALITITRDVQELVNGTVCTGTFVSGSDALLETIGGLDMILGQPFLRNVYAKFNFGDRIIGAPSTVSPKNSSIQILSMTDLNSAIPDFVTSRQAALAASLPEIPPATVVSMLQNGQL